LFRFHVRKIFDFSGGSLWSEERDLRIGDSERAQFGNAADCLLAGQKNSGDSLHEQPP
jgi:hypothetical protein